MENVIVRIKFKNGETMMFGSTYKQRMDQVSEYAHIFKTKAEKIEISDSKWIGWGGLKWCSESEFQNELNREGCQDNEQDNPNPRKYSDMVFVDYIKSNKMTKGEIKND
jgi:hypothetical protein